MEIKSKNVYFDTVFIANSPSKKTAKLVNKQPDIAKDS